MLRIWNEKVDNKNKFPVSAYSFLNMFYTHKQLIYAVAHPLFNYMFQIYLCSIGRVRKASDADISVIFL